MKETKIKVEGMVCEGCENRVKNALRSIDGVEKVEASFQKGEVTIFTQKEISKAVLEEKIEDIGFEVVKEEQ